MIRIVLDTNIYLNFYRMSDQTLFLLDKIVEKIEAEEMELILPVQIKNEFYLRKSTVIRQVVAELKDKLSVGNCQLPALLNNCRAIKDVKEYRKKLSDKYQGIIDEYSRRATNPQSAVNKKIEKVFEKASVIGDSDTILQKAKNRHLRGFPPKKDNHDFGDEIVWETLLEHCSGYDLIIVVSNDSDYESEAVKGEINEFLEKEWKETKGKNIKLEKSLTRFMKPYIDKARIKEEVINETQNEEEEASIQTSKLDQEYVIMPSRSIKTSDYIANTSSVPYSLDVETGRVDMGNNVFISAFPKIDDSLTISSSVSTGLPYGNCRVCGRTLVGLKPQGVCDSCSRIQ